MSYHPRAVLREREHAAGLAMMSAGDAFDGVYGRYTVSGNAKLHHDVPLSSNLTSIYSPVRIQTQTNEHRYPYIPSGPGPIGEPHIPL